MQRRQYILLILAPLLFAGAWLLQYQWNAATRSGSVERLSAFIQEQEGRLQDYSGNGKLVVRHLLGFSRQDKENPVSGEELEDLEKQPFSIFFFRSDSLVFWSNQSIQPPDYQPQLSEKQEARWFVRLEEGDYAVWAKRGKHSGTGPFVWMAVIPLKISQTFPSSYASSPAPWQNELELTTEETPHPVKWSNGQPVCFAREDLPPNRSSGRWLILLAWLPALFVTGWLFTQAARTLSRKTDPRLGLLFLIALIAGLRLLSYWLGIGEFWNDLFLFQHKYNIPLNERPVDFLINNLLLLWIVLFSYVSRPEEEKEHPGPLAFLLTLVNYILVILTLSGLALFTRYLIFHNPVSFAGASPFDLDWSSLFALYGIVLLFLSFFLLGYRLLLFVNATPLSLSQRIGAALIVALAFALPAYFLLDQGELLLILLPAALTFIILFEIFIRTGMGLNFFWFLIWILLLSGYSGFLISHFDNQKNTPIRKEFAETLLPVRDSIAEAQIRQFVRKVKDDQGLRRLVNQSPDSLLSNDSIKTYLNKHFQKEEYLFFYYGFQPYVFQDRQTAGRPSSNNSPDTIRFPLARQVVISFPDIRFGYDKRDQPVYRAEMDLASDSLAKLIVQFQLKRDAPSELKSGWLRLPPYRGLEGLQDFSFYIFSPSGMPIIRSDEQDVIPSYELTDLKPGESSGYIMRGSTYSIYVSEDGFFSIVGGQQDNYLKFISLTSLIFALTLLSIFILNMIHLLVRILPRQLNLILAGPPSMRRRVQSAFIWLTIVFFIITGLTTIRYFQDSRAEFTQARLKQKRDAVMENLRIELGEEASMTNLLQSISTLSAIHQVNLHLYSPRGRLIRSSEKNISSGSLSDLINPVAYHLLSSRRKNEIAVRENIGPLQFDISYESIFGGENNDRLLGFLGIPFFAEQQQMRSDLNQFLGALLNVYVFLFLIAAAVSVFFSNNLTDGITQIGEKMRAFKLGGKNEPLGWKRKDEVGALVEEYNKMIAKLEDSAFQLAQSEREDAWKEMAKQIAHEIKNPLTPMLLRAQQLPRIYERDPEQLEEKLKSTSRTLIEQIESLKQIANEFSAFAKMPDPQNERVELNQLVESVVNLFEDEDHADLYKYLPNETLVSFVDKGQLVRVLNNLIKNALQAIPEDRRGDIGIHLFQRDQMAVIMVEDNGSGISEDKQEKVFVPNFTTKSSGKGLGLAIARNVVAAANGKIYFETEANKGTKFFVELPLIE